MLGLGIKKELRKWKILKELYYPVKQVILKKKDKEFLQINLQKIQSVNSEKMHIWFFCIPVHPNMGDQAQSCCIMSWLKKNYPDSQVIPLFHIGNEKNERKIMDSIKGKVKAEDLLLFQSGYTMLPTHPYVAMHKKVLAQYPNNKVVFLPQTVLYRTDTEKKNAATLYDNRSNVLLLTRDKVSDKYARTIFPNLKIKLFPDIVTSQIGNYHFESERSGILFCMRNDEEKFYSDAKIEQLIKQLSEYGLVERTDTTCDMVCTSEREEIWKVIEKTFERYSKYKLIITDRYHGTIFSLISGTPVIVMKTTDHKVATGVDWFKGVYDDYVYFADTLEDINKLVKKIWSKELTYSLEPYFEQHYYQNLKQIIEEID